MEERGDLEDQLIAVRDELLDRDEDPELVGLVYQRMEWLYDADTPELADDAQATIPHLHHLWCGTRHVDLTIDHSAEDVCDEENIGEDYGPRHSLSWWCHPLEHLKHTKRADRD